MRPVRAGVASPDYAWMLDLLFSGPAVAWAASGALPSGYDRVGRLAALPTGPGRSFLVSLASRRAAASALTCYNALRSSRKRVVRRVLGLGLLTGLAQPLLRSKIDIGIRQGGPAARCSSDLLDAHLATMFGVPQVSIAIGGGEGPYRKPVVQAFSAGGSPLGYVKVGWNDWTRDGVRREAAALRACSTRSLRLGVPELVSLSGWQGLDLVATAPMPSQVRGLAAAAPLPDVSVLREISSLSPGYVSQLRDSLWWQGVRSRVAACTHPAARGTLDLLVARLERSSGSEPVAFGFCHGDFVPWNLAWLGDRLYAWDWESSAPDMPVGFDAVHYYFQASFVARGLPLPQAVAHAAALSRPALRQLTIPPANSALVVALHLVELFLRHEAARDAAGTADDRFYPAVTGVLDQYLGQAESHVPGAVGRIA
jgi:Phosphotransferase enzyme family